MQNKKTRQKEKSTTSTNIFSLSYSPVQKWGKVKTNTGNYVSCGACYNTLQISLDDLTSFLSGIPIQGINDNRTLSQLCMQVESYNSWDSKELIASLPKEYKEIVLKWKENVHPRSEAKKKFKASLPAVLPSVIFHMDKWKKEDNGGMGPKASMKYNGTYWEHSGYICVEADLGESHGNTDDPDLFWDTIKECVPHKVPGFVLMWQSINKGIKILFKVSAKSLNDEEPFERIRAHEAIYSYLFKKCTESCNNSVKFDYLSGISTLQFLSRGVNVMGFQDIGLSSPDTLEFDDDEIDELYRLIPVAKGKPKRIDVTGNGSNGLPDLVKKDFTSWLESQGYTAEANCILNELILDSGGYRWTSECPVCKDYCTGSIGNKDLSFQIGEAGDSWFHCFHNTCRTGEAFDKTTGAIKRIHSMDSLWKTFLQCVLEKDWEKNNTPKQMERSVHPKSVKQSTSTRVEVIREPMDDWPEMQEIKKGNDVFNVPRECDVNVEWFIKECLGIHMGTDCLSKDQRLIFHDGSTAYPTRAIVNSIVSLIERRTGWAKKERVERILDHKCLMNKYHPFLDAIPEKWDGKDHIAELASTLIPLDGWDPSSEEVSIDPKEYIHRVIRTFILGVYSRVSGHYEGRPSDVHTVPIIPVLVGEQRIGKNRFVKRLLPEKVLFGIEERPSIDTNDKDDLSLIIKKIIIHLDEIDANTRNISTLARFKALLTRATINYRAPYDRTAVDYTPQASFIGSTNHETFLYDDTGSRRFFSLFISKIDHTKGVNINRGQVWAQAKHLIDVEKVSPWVDPLLEDLSIRNNEMYATIETPSSSIVSRLEYVSRPEERDLIPESFTTVEGIFEYMNTNIFNGAYNYVKANSATYQRTIGVFKTELRTLAGVGQLKSARYRRKLTPFKKVWVYLFRPIDDTLNGEDVV